MSSRGLGFVGGGRPIQGAIDDDPMLLAELAGAGRRFTFTEFTTVCERVKFLVAKNAANTQSQYRSD